MGLLALELVALVMLFAADDAAHHRPPAVTWGTSVRVIAASAAAVAACTWLRPLIA
ncbi:MAG: hypothetical protein QOJ29_1026 [Thermoleophilaceae bacterium]|jgi:hypothetical protein|nr:hypothetical protein [Thermoleophilaceae bacterium]